MKKARKLTPANRCDSCDAELDTKRRFCGARCTEIHLCTSKGNHKYRHHFVATEFQMMIRAEAAAKPHGIVRAVVNGIIRPVHRLVGECVCVTCGTVGPWIGGRGRQQMQTGHFCSRKDQSVLLNALNVAVQCAGCNQPPGSPNEFRLWMINCRGVEVITFLESLARKPFAFTREQLVDKRLACSKRLKAAEAKMKGI